jgi:protein-disulfide isomerase
MLRIPVTPRDHVLGPLNAPVTLVEYGDYECFHCALTQVHPHAEAAAESAEFCGAHGLFWEMHDGIYENQDRLGLPLLFALANGLGLSEAALRECLANGIYEEKVRSDFVGGVRSGVNGTPSFFINGRRHEGSYAFSDLVSAVEANLPAKVQM